jgi:hypothetical protein
MAKPTGYPEDIFAERKSIKGGRNAAAGRADDRASSHLAVIGVPACTLIQLRRFA